MLLEAIPGFTFYGTLSLREKCPNTELSGHCFPVFGLNTQNPNAGKFGPEKLCIWTLFTQCITLFMEWKIIE